MATYTYNKIQVDDVSRIISIVEAPISDIINFDIKTDLYSDLKQMWLNFPNLRRLMFPMSAVGGNELPGSKALGSTFFINPDWKIRPYEADHRFIVNGNFYSVDGASPYTPTLGTWAIFIEQQVSSLVDSTIQQLPEIQYSTYQNSIWVDAVNGTDAQGSVEYPLGNRENPVTKIEDAMAIADSLHFNIIHFLGDYDVPANTNLSGYTFVGQNTNTHITLGINCNVNKTVFVDMFLSNSHFGEFAYFKHCFLTNVTGLGGYVEDSILSTSVSLLNGVDTYFVDCKSACIGLGPELPVFDFNGTDINVAFRNWSGPIKYINMNNANTSTCLDIVSGSTVIIEPSCTLGTLYIRGTAAVQDNSNGTTVSGESVINKAVIADEVWNGTDGAAVKVDIGNIWTVVDTVRKHQTNKTKIDHNNFTLTIYDDDEVTPLHVFDLQDKNGLASITEIFVRVPQ